MGWIVIRRKLDLEEAEENICRIEEWFKQTARIKE